MTNKCDPDAIQKETIKRYAWVAPDYASASCYMDFLRKYHQFAQPERTDKDVEEVFTWVKHKLPNAYDMTSSVTGISYEGTKEDALRCERAIKELTKICSPAPYEKEWIEDQTSDIARNLFHVLLNEKTRDMLQAAEKATTRLEKVEVVEEFASTHHHGGLLLGYACGGEDNLMEEVAKKVLNCLAGEGE